MKRRFHLTADGPMLKFPKYKGSIKDFVKPPMEKAAMSDQALIAERDDWKRRAEANHAACEVMKRQLEECAAAKATVERVLAKLEQQVLRLEDENRSLKIELTRRQVDREFSV